MIHRQKNKILTFTIIQLFLAFFSTVCLAWTECEKWPVGNHSWSKNALEYASRKWDFPEHYLTVVRKNTSFNSGYVRVFGADKENPILELQFDQNILAAVTNKNGSKLTVVAEGEIFTYEVKSGKILDRTEFKPYSEKMRTKMAFVFPDQNKVIAVGMANWSLVFFEPRTREKFLSWESTQYVRKPVVEFTPDGSKGIVTLSCDVCGTDHFAYNFKNHQRIAEINNMSGDDPNIAISPDGAIAHVADPYSFFDLNLNSGVKSKLYKIPSGEVFREFSHDGTKVLTSSGFYSNSAFGFHYHIYETKTGLEVSNRVDNVKSFIGFTPDSKKAIFGKDDQGRIVTLDLKSGEIYRYFNPVLAFRPDRQDSLYVMPNSQVLMPRPYNDSYYVFDLEGICVEPPEQKFSREESLRLLSQFSKEGINLKNDFPKFLALIRSPSSADFPNLIADGLLQIHKKSNLLFEDLLRREESLKTLRPRIDVNEEQKLTEMDLRNAYTDEAYKIVEDLVTLNSEKSTLKDWTLVILLKEHLTDQNKNEYYLDKAAESMKNSAVDTGGFFDVYSPKIEYFIYHGVASLFNVNEAPLTDLTLTRKDGQLNPVILGTQPIDGDESTRTGYGFYAKRLAPSDLASLPWDTDKITAVSQVKWSQNGKTFSADIKATRGSNSRLKSEALQNYDFASIRAKKSLNGIFVIGANMGALGDLSYARAKLFYINEGYIFSDKKPNVPDFPKYMGEQISQGNLDYLFKEAHSDGDEKHLFAAPKSAIIEAGSRQGKDGVLETIQIVKPSPGTAVSRIENSDFGEWIRQRDFLGNRGVFTYFNTSCNSYLKAVHEYESAKSLGLLIIATASYVWNFGAPNANGGQIILKAFLDRKNFRQTKYDLQSDKLYVEGRQEQYIFPGDDKYQKLVRKTLEVPLNLNVQLFDQNGQRYSPPTSH